MAPDDRDADEATPDQPPSPSPDGAATGPDAPAAAEPATAPEAAAAPRAEPRARDLLQTRTSDELQGALDPATIAQLASWFGLPSFAELEAAEAAAGAAAEAPADPFADRKELMARIAEVADARLLARIDRFREADHELIRPIVPDEPTLDPSISSSDPDFVERFAGVAEPREFQLPEWLEDALDESSPQAILRDLYRPESTFEFMWEQPEPAESLGDLRQEIRDLALAPYKVGPNPPLWPEVVASLADVLRWKRAAWAELPITRRPRAAAPAPVDDE